MSNNVKKKTVKVHLYDILAALIYFGHKVTPQDIAEHLRGDLWSDVEVDVIEDAVRVTLETELEDSEDHYGLRENNGAYWLNYRINEFN